MSLYRLTYAPDEFAAELLPLAKQWLRIEHDDDDAALTSTLISAATHLERQLDIAVIPAQWEWIPQTYAYPHGGPDYARLYLPIRGAYAVTVLRDSVDVSADYAFPGLYPGNYSQVPVIATGASATVPVVWGDVFTLDAGITDTTNADYGLRDLLLRYTAYLWENREAASALALHDVPDWLSRAWATYWTPRA